MLPQNVTNKYLIKTYSCQICQKTFETVDELKEHVSKEEHLSEWSYFNMYIKPRFLNEGKCLKCGRPTKFIDLVSGYEDYCSSLCANNDLDNHVSRTISK